MNIPKKIKKCPIIDAICEIRFSTDTPVNAVFGVIYNILNKDLKDFSRPVNLPISQIPENIRENDQNLRYQPCQRLEKGNIGINIGTRVMIFTNQKPYTGWDIWEKSILEITNSLVNNNFFSEIERISLRYVNVFADTNISDIAHFNVNLGDISFNNSKPITFRTELNEEGITTILQCCNNINIFINTEKLNGAIIDITKFQATSIKTGDTAKAEITEILRNLHEKEKELFYRLLKDDFVKKLEPIYE